MFIYGIYISDYREELAEKIKEAGASKFARRQSEGAESAARSDREELSENDARGPEENEAKSETADATKTTEGASRAKKNNPENDARGSDKNNGKPEVAQRKQDVNSIEKLAKTKIPTTVPRTPFGDPITPDAGKNDEKKGKKRRSLYYDSSDEDEEKVKDKSQCSLCAKESGDGMCQRYDR